MRRASVSMASRSGLDRAAERWLVGERQHLLRLSGRCVALRPDRRVSHERERLAERRRLLDRTVADRIRHERQRLAASTRQLDAVSPERVLQRGYSYTETEAGELLRSVDQARPGTPLRTTLVDGVVRSVVSGSSEAAELPGGVVPTRAAKRPKRNEEGEGGLF
jgi:exodeoxyribonuclease VII large subunit